VPVEVHHWQIYAFSAGTHVAGETSAMLLGVDANYGAAPNLRLHATVPIAYDRRSGGDTQFGYGDGEIGFKYRSLAEHQTPDTSTARTRPALI
jgi:hypothetical protein